MTTNEERLFHLALEQPAQQRSAFLEAACGDDELLRGRVEALLHAHLDPGSFLSRPAVDFGAVSVEDSPSGTTGSDPIP